MANGSLDRRLVCMDVGANEGLWSETLSRCARDAGRDVTIVAFEPSPVARANLEQRLRGIENLMVEGFALGARSGLGVLRSDAEGSGLASLYERRLDYRGISMTSAQDVGVITLDEYCARRGIKRIDLLKLDVEGAELDVLHGAAGLLEQGSVGVVQFEFGGCNIDSRTFFQDFWYLLHDRFDLYRVLRDGLWPVAQYEERHERFVTTNFVAISR